MNIKHLRNPFERGNLFCRNIPSVGRSRASLVVRWLRLRLAMQGTEVRSLAGEGPTGCGAVGPVCHSYWACALEPWTTAVVHTCEAHVPERCIATRSQRTTPSAQPRLPRGKSQRPRPAQQTINIKRKKALKNREVPLPPAISKLNSWVPSQGHHHFPVIGATRQGHSDCTRIWHWHFTLNLVLPVKLFTRNTFYI